MSERGEFRKRLDELLSKRFEPYEVKRIYNWLLEAEKEYPQVSQQWVPVKGNHVDWKTLTIQMEQKIIAFENFGKKWFGGGKADGE